MKTSQTMNHVQLPTKWTSTKDVAEFSGVNIDTTRRYLKQQHADGNLLRMVVNTNDIVWKTPSNSEALNFTVPTEWTTTRDIAEQNNMKRSDTICKLSDYYRDGLVLARSLGTDHPTASCTEWKMVVKTHSLNAVDGNKIFDRQSMVAVTAERADMDVTLSSEWCICADEAFLCYPEDGACDCGIIRHHVHCTCGKVTQIG